MDSGLRRDEVFITSKVCMGKAGMLASMSFGFRQGPASRRAVGCLHCMIAMHSPVPSRPIASALLTPCSCGPALLAWSTLLMPCLLVVLTCGKHLCCVFPAPCTPQLWTSNWGRPAGLVYCLASLPRSLCFVDFTLLIMPRSCGPATGGTTRRAPASGALAAASSVLVKKWIACFRRHFANSCSGALVRPLNAPWSPTPLLFRQSLSELDTSYLDLFLLHAPGDPGARAETWRALEDAQKEVCCAVPRCAALCCAVLRCAAALILD